MDSQLSFLLQLAGILMDEPTVHKPLVLFTFYSMSNYNPYVGRGRNGEVRRHRANTPMVQGGRKRHGSHRSHIIGKYKMQAKPVTELHQKGTIWM